jgi:thioredoxin-related protein
MISKPKAVLFMSLFSFCFTLAQLSEPQSSDDIMNAAYKQAKEENKNVFLIFHASWCSWCKRLDKAMNSDELKKIFEDNFVITHLDVQERNEKIALLENPGGKELMAKLGGEKSGLPFYAFLDREGKLISNSNVMDKETNIGYPGSEEEIAAFGKLLKLSSAKLSDEQLSKITEYLKTNAPKPRASTSNMTVIKPDSSIRSNMPVMKPDSSFNSNMTITKPDSSVRSNMPVMKQK